MVFIVGMGRSGTTLLTTMLNTNKQVVACPENEFVLFTEPYFKQADFSNEKIVDEFVNLFHYSFSKTISFWKPTADLKEKILQLEDKTFSSICKQVYLCYPFAKDKQDSVTCIIDKNPIYSLYMNKLHQLFPNAKYIVLTRDYRDNCASRKKVSGKKDSIYVLANSWNYFYNCIFKSIKKNNLNYIQLRYEDIVTNSTESLSKLCTFLNITFSKDMLQFQELSKEMKHYVKQNLSPNEQEKLNHMHHNLENEISKNRVASYMQELSAKEIEYLDIACLQFAKQFNYTSYNSKTLNWHDQFWNQMSIFKIKLYYNLHPLLSYLPLKWRIKK